jgi:hypothetical protein
MQRLRKLWKGSVPKLQGQGIEVEVEDHPSTSDPIVIGWETECTVFREGL